MSGSGGSRRYVQETLIGKGSYGDVFAGVDTETGKRVALKIIDLEEVEDDIDEVRHEVMALADCLCPQITEYYNSELLPDSTKLLIAMELMACSAADLLEAAPLDEAAIAYALRQLVHALHYLHSMRRMHRDVKAANVLLTRGAVVKISDFGVSGQLSSTLGFKRRTFVGTPYWMAPEVIESSEEGYTKAADIWSLGITAIELATQRPPYADMHPMRVLFLIPKSEPPVLEGNFSKELKHFVSLCLAKEPSKRPLAQELLSHPFLQVDTPPPSLVAAVDRLIAERETASRSKKEASKKPASEGTIKLLPPAPIPAWDFDSVGATIGTATTSAPTWDTGTVRASHAELARGGAGVSARPVISDTGTVRAMHAGITRAPAGEDSSWDGGTVRAVRDLDRFPGGAHPASRTPRDPTLLLNPAEEEAEVFRTKDAREMSASRAESLASPYSTVRISERPVTRHPASTPGGRSVGGDSASGQAAATAAVRQSVVASVGVLREVLAPSLKSVASQAFPAAVQPALAAADGALQALAQLEAAREGACLDFLSHALTLIAAASGDPSPDVKSLHHLACSLFDSAGDGVPKAGERSENPMRQFLIKRWQASAKRELLHASRLSMHT